MAELAFNPPCPIAEVAKLLDEEFVLPLECVIPELPKPKIGFTSPNALGLFGPRGLPGPKGEKGEKGDKGDPGDKYAIVTTSEGPRGLYCPELPECWFLDIMQLTAHGGDIDVMIDPLFLETIEPGSLRIISASTDTGAVAYQLSMSRLHLYTQGQRGRVVVLLGGIRLGRDGKRFPEFSLSQQTANVRFWESAIL